MNGAVESAVRFERVSKSIGATRILEDVSFEVPRGSAFSILGCRGTGKTIALKLSIGLLRPDEGRIFINGEEITALDTAGLLRIRQSTGFVFQNAAVFDSMPVAENIAFPLRHNSRAPESEIQEKVCRQLLEVGLERDGDKMPTELSVGMRKLLSFARALAGNPGLLLLDDPWNGVDAISAVHIRKLLLGLKQRQTTLLVAENRMTEGRHIADRLAILDGGRVIAHGTPGELARLEHPTVRQFLSQEDT